LKILADKAHLLTVRDSVPLVPHELSAIASRVRSERIPVLCAMRGNDPHMPLKQAKLQQQLCDGIFGRTLVIAMDNLINRSNLYQAAFLQEDCPIAH